MHRYTLYIDESGVPNLAEESRYFILSGLIVEEKVDQEISAYFNYIKRRYSIDKDKNFHAVDFFEDKTCDIYLSNSNANKFCISLCEFMETAPFSTFIWAVDKKEVSKLVKLPNKYKFVGNPHKEDKDFPYELLARKLFLPFAHFLKKKKAIGAIVAESRRSSDRTLLKTYLDCQEKGHFKSKKYQKYADEFRDRVVSLRFENKNSMRGGLELADIYSYITYQKLGKKISPTMKRRGVNTLDKVIVKQLMASEQKGSILLTNRAMKELAHDRIDKITKTVTHKIAESAIQP